MSHDIKMLDCPDEDWQEQLQGYLHSIKSESQGLKKEDWKRRFELIREGYLIVHDELMKRAAKGRTINPYWLVWDWSPIEYAAWIEIRRSGMPLYPQYPFMHYFLDFADPYRKICIELDGRKWHNAEKDAIRDETLARWGWQVFRIPGHIANKTKLDVLPEHLRYVAQEGGTEEEEDELKQWEDKVAWNSIDGFFNWIWDMYYANVRGQHRP